MILDEWNESNSWDQIIYVWFLIATSKKTRLSERHIIEVTK